MKNDRKLYLQGLDKRMEAWEEYLADTPDAPDYHYWFIKNPPKERLPKRGEIWEWTWIWACGTPSVTQYEVLRIKGRTYPYALFMDRESRATTMLLLRSAPGEWKRIGMAEAVPRKPRPIRKL